MLRSLFLLLILGMALNGLSQEICDNGIDDDNDGFVDINDTTDCICTFTTETPESLIPNPSFESTVCCPSTGSELSCAEYWIQAGIATTDYYNTCGNMTGQMPFLPGSTGHVGFINSPFWNEYTGACLTGPLLAGTSYTLTFYIGAFNISFNPSLDMQLYGTPDCSDLPWSSVNCPNGIGQWNLLDNQQVTLAQSSVWQQVTLTFTPTVNINAIALGGSCMGSGGGYFFMDELILNSTNLFGGQIEGTGHWCTNDLVLNISDVPTAINPQWYLDGVALVGETSDSINVMNYSTGLYSVRFNDGGSCMQADYLVAPDYPEATFYTAVGSGCLGTTIVLVNDTAASPVDVDNWEWLMDDGSLPSSSYNQFYTYANPGTYNVSLIASTDEGCIDTLTTPIEIYPLPDAIFDITVNGVNYPVNEGDTVVLCGFDQIQFGDLSSIDAPDVIQQYDWNFGDMNVASVPNPTHQYNAYGYYDVNLLTTSNHGCVDNFAFVIQIAAIPVADFSTINSACLSESLQFTNNSSIGVGTITSYQWQFGDSQVASTLNPIHQYANDGNFDVQLVVMSDFGCTDTLVTPVTIYPEPIADFQIQNHCVNETIDFIDQSTIVNGTINTWQWQFGDNNTSAIASPSHDYAADGNYPIRLIVETGDGCKDTLDLNYTIYPAPEVDFEVENACENSPVNFTNNSSISSGSITQYNWDFGNSTNANVAVPTAFSYPDDGIYSIQLELVSDQGCVSVDSADLTIYESPIAQILGDPMVGCSPFDAPMFNFVNAEAYRCEWDFGDGHSVIDCGSVRNTYAPGIYDVSLKVYSEHECVDSVTEFSFVTVNEMPVADFLFSPQKVTINNNSVNFTNLTFGGVDYVWDFNDGSEISTETHPNHDFPNLFAGTYSVSLVAFNAGHTCADSIVKTIVVQDEVIFYIPNAFTPGGDDNHNALFQPVFTSGIDIYAYTLTIFNRWGEVLFVSHDPAVGWDGTYKSADLVQGGVYIWQVNYEVANKDERFTERGVVNVVR